MYEYICGHKLMLVPYSRLLVGKLANVSCCLLGLLDSVVFFIVAYFVTVNLHKQNSQLEVAYTGT